MLAQWKSRRRPAPLLNPFSIRTARFSSRQAGRAGGSMTAVALLMVVLREGVARRVSDFLCVLLHARQGHGTCFHREPPKLIPAGSNIVIQVHYSKTTGKIEKDRTSVGLFLRQGPPREGALRRFGVINHYFKIPPGADNHEVKACYTFSRDVELLTFLPHMHVRGKDMKYEAIYPDGRRETVLFCPQLRFQLGRPCTNWRKPLALPKGDKDAGLPLITTIRQRTNTIRIQARQCGLGIRHTTEMNGWIFRLHIHREASYDCKNRF
jgi:hypothetical protein